VSAGQMGDDDVFCGACGQALFGPIHSSEGCIASLRASLSAAEQRTTAFEAAIAEQQATAREWLAQVKAEHEALEDAVREAEQRISDAEDRCVRELAEAKEIYGRHLGEAIDAAHASGRLGGLGEAAEIVSDQMHRHVNESPLRAALKIACDRIRARMEGK
jgi:hypothetical protein